MVKYLNLFAHTFEQGVQRGLCFRIIEVCNLKLCTSVLAAIAFRNFSTKVPCHLLRE
jgi:hypothetical protein